MKRIIECNSWFLILLLTLGCVNSEDLVTDGAKEGGALLTSIGSEGKLLGVEDPLTKVVSFTDNDLTFNVDLVLGRFNDESFTLVKQFNGQEVEVEDFDELPYSYSITSLSEFLDGFTGVTPDDLRIGDVVSYRVKIHTKDGRTLVSNDAKIDVTVNCGSDLAGTYTVTGVYNRPESGIVDLAVGPRMEEILKYGVNYYGTQQTGHWANAVLGFEPCPIFFSVTCGQIEIESQYLCNAYSNLVSGSGYVDEVTGNIHLEYQVTGGNLRTYAFTLVKQ